MSEGQEQEAVDAATHLDSECREILGAVWAFLLEVDRENEERAGENTAA